MRPAGEVRQALLQAAADLATAERAPTQRELAEAAQVSYCTARYMVPWLHRAGALRIVRTRRVDYRNRPVAEYAPALAAAPAARCELSAVMQRWGVPA